MSSDNKTYSIKSGGHPSGNPAKYNYSLIQTLLDATSPEKVSAAGTAFNNAAKTVAQAAHELYLVGGRLSQKWEGADADALQKALGQLYATANELYGTSQQTGKALETYGSTLRQYKGLKWPPDGASPVEDQARQQAAEKVMQSLNQQIGTAWATMPDKVHQNLPGLQTRDEHPYSPGAGSTGTGGGASGLGDGGVSLPHVSKRGGAGGSPGGVSVPHLPHGSENGFPGGPSNGHGADLAGIPSAGGGLGTNAPSTGSPFPSGTAGGAPSVPAGGGLTPGGLNSPSLYPGAGLGPSAVPRSGLGSGKALSEEASPSGLTEAESAAASRAAAAEEAGASQAVRSGPMGAPGGSGAGTTETERERATWLAEEKETWGAKEDVLGQTLGTPLTAGTADEAETERQRGTWLAEDNELWTGGETWPSGILGDTPPQGEDAKGADITEKVEEFDVLDPERLQELLDVVIAQDEKGDSPNTPEMANDFLEDLRVEDVNDIDRWLNG